MDADRFDAFIKTLGLSAARRGVVSGLLGGSLGSLLAALDSEARGHTGRKQGGHDNLSAEKRKKHKKKKHKNHHKKGGPKDEAPPCTEESCPLPPGCSQSALDECSAALKEALLADAEACASECEGGDSPACRACLEPIVLARLPDARACVLESCYSNVQDAAKLGRAEARAWWNRLCDKPCCRRDYDECMENARDAWIGCCAAALAAFAGGPVAGGAAFALCIAGLAYLTQSCDARYGCATGAPCRQGDVCCSHNSEIGCNGECCSSGSQCCSGGGCCNSQSVCCRTPVVDGEGGEHYCCAPGLRCHTSGPHSHTCESGSG